MSTKKLFDKLHVENCDINQFTTQVVHLSNIEICGHTKVWNHTHERNFPILSTIYDLGI
jgi:hypothetical protein